MDVHNRIGPVNVESFPISAIPNVKINRLILGIIFAFTLLKTFMKTFNKLLIISACLVSSSVLKAQGLSGGVEGAFTTSSVKISEISHSFTDAINGNGIPGFEGGLFLNLDMGPFYLKPKLLLDYQSGPMRYSIDQVEHEVHFQAGKLLIPVLVGFRFLPVLGLEAGPVYNHILFVTDDFNGYQVDLKKDGIGYRIGLNARLSMLNLTVSYQGLKNNGSVTSASTYQTPNQLIFGIGLQF